MSSWRGLRSRLTRSGFGAEQSGISRRDASRHFEEFRRSARLRSAPLQGEQPRDSGDERPRFKCDSYSISTDGERGEKRASAAAATTTTTTTLVIERGPKTPRFRSCAYGGRRTTPRRVVAPASRARARTRASFPLTFFLARKSRLAPGCPATAVMMMTTATTTTAAAAAAAAAMR